MPTLFASLRIWTEAVAVTLGFVAIEALNAWVARRFGHAPVIWLGNGLLLGFLLDRRGGGIARILTLALLADMIFEIGFHAYGWLLAAVIAACKISEIAIAYGMLRGRLAARPDPARPGALLRLVTAALVAPVFPVLFAADAAFYLAGRDFAAALTAWYLPAVLGFAVVTPLVLTVLRPSARGEKRDIVFWLASFRYFAFLLAVASFVFSQSHYPLRFLVFPPLLLIAARRSLMETAIATFLTAAIIFGFTLSGRGPISLLTSVGVLSPGEKIFIAQIFVLVLGICVLAIAAWAEQTRRLRDIAAQRQHRLRESERRYRILVDHSRDVIYRMSPDGGRLYVSPAAERLFGFSAEEQVGSNWRTDVHPEDWPAVRKELRKFAQGADTIVFPYRRRCKDGTYLWVETRVGAVYDPVSGAVREYIANSRDISAQKAAEEQLNAMNTALVTLAATDGLTGIANRRAFDEVLEREWRRTQREATPIALLMIHVDHFKSFNDFYGHLAGDDSLRRLAAAISGSLHRPGDLAARFGGEEFAVLLPGTDVAGADEIAWRIRDAVAGLGIVHEVTPLGRISISIGIASDGPDAYHDPSLLVRAADRALYAAKEAGRNRSVIATSDDFRVTV